MLEEALKLAKYFRVFPVHSVKGRYCTCGNLQCGKQSGKHPRLNGWQQAATQDHNEVTALWKQFPGSNIGVATGRGILVVDFDDYESDSAVEARDMLNQTTVASRTGRSAGGEHWFYHTDSTQLSVLTLNGVDIRGEGGYVVAPPSKHLSGRTYEWINAPDETFLAELPKAFITWAQSKRKILTQQTKTTIEAGGKVANGQRHDYMRNEIYKRVQGGMAPDDVREVVHNSLMKNLDGELEQSEVEALISGAVKRRQALTPDTDKLTEVGLADSFVAYYGGEVAYTDEDEWYKYDGGLWVKVVNPEKLVLPVRDLVYQAVGMKDGKRFYERSGTLNFVTNVAKLAGGSLRRELSTPDDTLPFRNGLYAMVEGTFRHFRLEDYVKDTLTCDYVPGAKCLLWEETIAHITGGDSEVARYHQQVFGYLVGTRTMRGVFYLIGPKNTGKTTLINTLADILGEAYAGVAQLGLIHQTRSLNEDEDMARCAVPLVGRRFVFMDETKRESQVDSGKFKRLASTNIRLVARKLRYNAFSFVNKAKVVVLSNNQPNIDADDEAAWDRVKYLPFLIPIPDGTRRETFRHELLAEASGIMNWCIEGFQDWLAHGFQQPATVAEQVQSWQEEHNPVLQFIQEVCQVNAEVSISPTSLYSAYQEWHGVNHLGKEGKFEGRDSFIATIMKLVPSLTRKRTSKAREIVGICTR